MKSIIKRFITSALIFSVVLAMSNLSVPVYAAETIEDSKASVPLDGKFHRIYLGNALNGNVLTLKCTVNGTTSSCNIVAPCYP